MTNQEALDLLEEFTTEAETAIRAAVWARAFLIEGGEPTWDAVKSVAWSGQQIANVGDRVRRLAHDDVFQSITPF